MVVFLHSRPSLPRPPLFSSFLFCLLSLDSSQQPTLLISTQNIYHLTSLSTSTPNTVAHFPNMRFTYFFTAALTLVSSLASAAPSAPVASYSHPDFELVSSVHNLTSRTYSNSWVYDKCDKIQGSIGWGPFAVDYDLGCLCLSDVDDFCAKNGLQALVANWIKNSVSHHSSLSITIDNTDVSTEP